MILLESYRDAAPVEYLAQALESAASGQALVVDEATFGSALVRGASVLRVTPHGQWDSCDGDRPHLAYSIRWAVAAPCGDPSASVSNDCPTCVGRILGEELFGERGPRVQHTWWKDVTPAIVLTPGTADRPGEGAEIINEVEADWAALAGALADLLDAGPPTVTGERLLEVAAMS
ncbi:hypothetical protein [Kitasatospora sp. A2-31]|uniref:hypothetical protein n=1 Tax=Kitasatospora sp. A2-31 TaxID=2916414 RepID=UPI001EEC5777|nr:hypothetical protein [Kitasatospora sp. A2-31]MCG6497006.1 hypothetical protein [Kitasatospora sp. A2-31]